MYHGNELSADKKRPRKQPPNQVWLDAIMSKSRSAEPSPVNGAVAMRPVRSTPTATETAPWRQPSPSHHAPHAPTYYPPMPSTRSSRTPSPLPAAYSGPRQVVDYPPQQDHVTTESAALAAAMAKALKDLVAEQECCFIARGICHLCGGNDKNLVPVINFCPAFSPTHSLCREHLRSMHRVRLEDIFAGKNQPTVSKKSLRCTVCALSCPCSKCQLERDAEFVKFKHAFLTDTPRERSLEEPNRRSRDQSDERTEQIDEDGMPRRRSHDHSPSFETAVADGKDHPSRGSYDEEKPVTSYDGEDHSFEPDSAHGHADDVIPPGSMAADAKPPTVPAGRVPKRAAKESVPYPLDVASASSSGRKRDQDDEDQDAVAASPSAGSVLNCPESERSLVDLLSSLNQRVTPAVRYFAEADESRFQTRHPEEEPTVAKEKVSDADATTDKGDEEDHANTNRHRKRKREVPKPVDEHPVTLTKESRSSAPKAKSVEVEQEDRDSISSYRRKAPAPLTTNEKKSKAQEVAPPTPSPRILSSTRIKFVQPPPQPPEPKPSSRKREPPAPSPPASSRKRKADGAVAAERKSPRESSHRGHAKSVPQASEKMKKAKKSRRSSAESDEEVIKYTADDDDEEEELEEVSPDNDDESELDSNLDYCEVCLAVGDLVCCDVCPRSFHLSCLKMTENDLPEGDWQCAECQKPSYFESFSASVDAKTTVQAKCVQIIKCLKSHPFAKPFLLPVEDIPHYSKIVKQPMDLSTVEKKLADGKYLNGKGTIQGAHNNLHLLAFAEDVRLVWANCKLFNDDGSGITRAADHLSEGFEKLYESVVAFSERLATKSSATIHPSGVSRQEEKKKAVAAAASDLAKDSAEKSRDQTESKTAPSLAPTESTSPAKDRDDESRKQPPAEATSSTERSLSPSPVTSSASSLTSSANTSPTETTGKPLDQPEGTTKSPEKKAPPATESSTSQNVDSANVVVEASSTSSPVKTA